MFINATEIKKFVLNKVVNYLTDEIIYFTVYHINLKVRIWKLDGYTSI
jgi:hypothetical protein